MRVLITGARGFVALHFAAAVTRLLDGAAEIIATSKSGGEYPPFSRVLTLDVTDEAAVAELIAELRPTHVMNLSGVASTMAAARDPDAAWRVHLQGALNLARAILRSCPMCWLLNVSSGLVYGDSANSGHPLAEATLLAPIDEYSASKAAADLALGALARRGLRCVRLRPFNHIGPGQSEDFVVGALAMQVARIEAGLTPPLMRVGNLNAQRDFLDVRDVADAYARVVRESERLSSGLILNIASGVPRRISDILDALIAQCRVAIAVEHDPGRMRPNDLPVIVGDSCRARKLLDWAPCYDFEQTLIDILDDCRRLARARLATAAHYHSMRQ
jgi:GDP-4-dehydro-6-deoxy-D-mannose reductase